VLGARQAPPVDAARLAAVAAASGYQVAADALTHALATDAACLAHARAGVLYPDHVVFLGGEACIVDDAASLPAIVAAYRQRNAMAPAALLVPGAGVLVARGAPGAAAEMLRCQAEVLLRVPAPSAIRCLTTDEVGELLNWDAEKFRQRLAH
jgi:rhamnose utilization protein RhaD (predicted bifunctional aldolase and dehydrogenase)